MSIGVSNAGGSLSGSLPATVSSGQTGLSDYLPGAQAGVCSGMPAHRCGTRMLDLSQAAERHILPGSVCCSMPGAMPAEVPDMPARRRGTWVSCSLPSGEAGMCSALPAALPACVSAAFIVLPADAIGEAR